MRQLSFIWLIFLVGISNEAMSQYLDICWPLGYDSTPRANLNFSSGSLVIDTVSRDMKLTNTSASISDSLGQIMALMNGCYITNELNDTMLNGDSLNPGQCTSSYCSFGNIIIQGNLILPNPANPKQFILFHETCDYSNGGNPIALYVSTIDFTLDSGKGGVINKNTIIFSGPLCNGNLTAVKHANGRDWWVLLHKRFTVESIVFLLDTSGISGPTIQSIGPIFDSVGYGTSCFSPNGLWYCTTTLLGDIHLFNFNRCNGTLSNYQYVDVTDPNGSYVSFSPSSNYLYCNTTQHIFQFDVHNITGSPFLVGNFDGYTNLYGPTMFGFPQLAPDGNIYLACGGGQNVMHVINAPDSFGLASDVQQHSIQLPCLNGGTVPSWPNYRLGPLSVQACDSLNEIFNLNDNYFKIYPNPVTEKLTIENSKHVNVDKLTISIYNSLGEVVIRQSLQTTCKHEINVSSLSHGIYILQVASNQLLYWDKFIKLE